MIRIRATTLRDWDRKELIVPNKELITGRLLNWSLSDAVTRVLVRVGVAYGSDVERALALLLEAAHENDAVLEDPEPSVNFEEFGDSSLNLSLRAFVSSLSVRLSTITALHAAIDRKYREAGIVIAFPQRDIHAYPVNDDDSPNIR
jgi:potassium efflux system protein